ncbi:MAG: IPT/TIG domain-containing protein, partial [Deltaproteobacteria bacterium]|nr:IPT/TIG domain-containing protein [Deltaproteobacteria bacterium]
MRFSHSTSAVSRALGLLGIAVALAGGCAEEVDGPTPAVSGLEPSLVCPEQLVTEILLTGERLSPLAIDAATDDPLLAIPDVELRRVQNLEGGSVSDEYVLIPNDPQNPGAARVRWLSTTSMAFEVYPELGLEPGAYEIRVTNRNGKEATFEMSLAVVPSPTVDTVEPDLICNEQEAQTVTITGTGFIAIRDAGSDLLPTVSIGDEDFTPESATDCVAIAATTLDAERCTTLSIVIPTSVTLEGEQPVTVTNPEPANCSSDGSTDVFFVAAPVIDAIDPDSICDQDQPDSLLVTGSGFLRIDDGAGGLTDPTITLDTTPVAVTFDAADCTPFTSTVTNGEVCTAFTLPLSSTLALGAHTVEITNPAPADCSDSADFYIVSAPTITDVQPPKVCADGDEFTVWGTGFTEGSVILLDGTPVPTTYVDVDQLTGTIEAGFTAGEYIVTVSNGTDCVS